MPAQKQMSKVGSWLIKVTANEVIRRLFVEMAHCEWIIDPLGLLFEMGLCECRASSCVTSEITTSAVRVRALAPLLTVRGRAPGGCFCGWRHRSRLCLCRRAKEVDPFSWTLKSSDDSRCDHSELTWRLSQTPILDILMSSTFWPQSLIYCLKVYFNANLIIFHVRLLNNIKPRALLWNQSTCKAK